MSETFRFKDIQNATDRDALRKGRCPWCLQKLTPVFEREKHIADKCGECEDTFTD